jgi:S-adenosylmethionine decarboxylase
MSLAIHSLIDFCDCQSERLADQTGLRRAMVDAVREAGGTYVTDIFHEFSPYGLSGVVVIAESHLAVHTWPEHGYAAVDIFSCTARLDQQCLIDRLAAWLGAASVHVDKRRRGIHYASPTDKAG